MIVLAAPKMEPLFPSTGGTLGSKKSDYFLFNITIVLPFQNAHIMSYIKTQKYVLLQRQFNDLSHHLFSNFTAARRTLTALNKIYHIWQNNCYELILICPKKRRTPFNLSETQQLRYPSKPLTSSSDTAQNLHTSWNSVYF